MNRSVCGIAVAFALLIGGAMLSTQSSANAGHHGCGGGGGLFGKHRGHGCAGQAVQRGCGGGLFSRLHARRHASSCCAPEPVCCAPQPVCAPEPTCCAPAPTCCAPAPVAQGCCPTDGVYGGSVMGHQGVYQQPGVYDQQYQQYPQGGQQYQQYPQDGQQIQQDAQIQADADVSSASDAPSAPQADAASDAPPAPQPE
jgi:hypothetical protein